MNQTMLATFMTAAFYSAAPALAADVSYHVTDKLVLDGPVRWDYLSMDAPRHRLFLTRGDHVDVFDLTTRRVVGSINTTAGVHGVATAPELGRGFTTNGATNNVTIFNLTTLKPITTVAVGSNPDALVYDPATQRVFVANAKGNSLSVISAKTGKMEGEIPLGGAPETAVVDGGAHLYVALEDRNAVAEVDTHTLKVLRRFSVEGKCDEPAGLAIDAKTKLLYAGCHNQTLTIIDAQTGAVVGNAPIGKGNDAVVIDEQRNLVFASNGDGTLNVISANAPFAVQATVPTMARARTMTIEPATHTLYLVSAEVDASKPTPSGGRPALKAGTFTLLTVAPQ
jgi:YVTN family beta-propeller protein